MIRPRATGPIVNEKGGITGQLLSADGSVAAVAQEGLGTKVIRKKKPHAELLTEDAFFHYMNTVSS